MDKVLELSKAYRSSGHLTAAEAILDLLIELQRRYQTHRTINSEGLKTSLELQIRSQGRFEEAIQIQEDLLDKMLRMMERQVPPHWQWHGIWQPHCAAPSGIKTESSCCDASSWRSKRTPIRLMKISSRPAETSPLLTAKIRITLAIAVEMNERLLREQDRISGSVSELAVKLNLANAYSKSKEKALGEIAGARGARSAR